jgi:hypothetical protein
VGSCECGEETISEYLAESPGLPSIPERGVHGSSAFFRSGVVGRARWACAFVRVCVCASWLALKSGAYCTHPCPRSITSSSYTTTTTLTITVIPYALADILLLLR